MLSDGFVEAVERRDAEAVRDALADGVAFRSPVVFRPYEGRDLVATILTEGAMKVFEDFRYRDRFESGEAAALIFAARVSDRELDGLDLLRFDGAGKVRELTVMVRPMSAVHALADAMARRFEALGITPPTSA
jgi:SnoaL-like protein